MSSTSTLSEQIVESVGTGKDPAVLDVLEGVTGTAAELNALTGATAANATTGKVAILGTSGAVTFAGALTIGTTTISEAEIGVLDAAAAANSGTGKAMILGTSGAVTIAGTATTAGIVTPPVVIPDATPYTVLAANSGKLHICPDFAANTTMNLPAMVNGARFRFQYGGAAADAHNHIIVAPAASYLKGGVTFVDNDAGAGADEMHAGIYANGSSHLTLTLVTPATGTWVEVVCDGTNYHLTGFVNSPTVPTIG